MDDRRLVSEEVATPSRNSDPIRSRTRRRILLISAGCGVFCLSASCTSNAPREVVDASLTIGIAEGSGNEGGPLSLAAALSQEGLTQLSVDGRPMPRLAESWQWEGEGRRLRVKVRQGVKFHNGKALDAAAIVRSLKRALTDRQNVLLYSSLSDIVDIHNENDQDVIFELSRPSAFLPEDLEIPITDHSDGATGTGPFQVSPRVDSTLKLTRFQGYYRGEPHIRDITIQPFRTLRTAWTSLLRGEIDMVTNVSPDAVDFVRTSDVEVISYPRRYQYMIVLNSRAGPFSSAAVRRAASLAIDRDHLVSRVMDGRGTPATSPLWPQHWAYDRQAPTTRFAPDLARTLLDEAGFPPDKETRTKHRPPARLRFTCLVPEDFLVLERLALEVQRQLAGVGIDMQFEYLPVRELGGRVNSGKFEAAILDMVSGPTIVRSYNFWRSRRNYDGMNVFGYENAEAERLFEVLRTSTNDAAVRSSVRALQDVFNEDPPALFLAWNERAQAVSRSFETVQEPGRDPLSTLWQWRPRPQGQLAQRQ